MNTLLSLAITAVPTILWLRQLKGFNKLKEAAQETEASLATENAELKSDLSVALSKQATLTCQIADRDQTKQRMEEQLKGEIKTLQAEVNNLKAPPIAPAPLKSQQFNDQRPRIGSNGSNDGKAPSGK